MADEPEKAEAMSSNVALAGWLTKRGGKFKTWRRRWFVFTPTSIMYYKNPLDEAPKGSIPVSDIYAMVHNPPDIKGKINSLAFCTPARTYYAFAETPGEANEWRDQIRGILGTTLYYTSQTGSRGTRGNTQAIKMLLDAKGVSYDEIDVYYMDEDDKDRLWSSAGTQELPQLFHNGLYVGDLERVQAIEDDGKLGDLLHLQYVCDRRASGISVADNRSTDSE